MSDETATTTKKPFWKKKKVWIPVAVVVALIVIGAATPKKTSTTDTTVAVAAAPVATEPMATDAPDTTGAPMTTEPFEVTALRAVRKVSEDKRAELVVSPDEFQVTIWYADNMTKGLSERSTQMRATKVLELSKSLAGGRPVTIAVRMELVNKLGETFDRNVLYAEYEQSTVDRIQFKNFDPTNIFSTSVANVSGVQANVACGLTDFC